MGCKEIKSLRLCQHQTNQRHLSEATQSKTLTSASISEYAITDLAHEE